MDFIELCLQIPNLAFILFYLVFILLIPCVITLTKSFNYVKFYMPFVVAIAYIIVRVVDNKSVSGLYELMPTEFVPFLSSNFINVLALFGIIWQSVEVSRQTSLLKGLVLGITLFFVFIPFSRIGLKYAIDNVDKYSKAKFADEFKFNWHLIVFGVVYLIFILCIQYLLLLGLSGSKIGNNINQNFNDSKLNKNFNNLKKNINEFNKKKTKNILDKYSLSNINNFIRA